jgi:D-beta-D-heptose 7-phosphate kinase / D-beta-D-heptose 1-phosphate adenosyltransferase
MNKSPRLIEWLPRLAEANVLCVGDVMLDRFVYGAVERISPEAPIPVLRITRQDVTVGGAGNVARNLSALETSVRLFGAVGDDAAGAEVRVVLEDDAAITLALLTEASRPTTVKTRYIAGVQQLLRTDDEDLSAMPPALLDQLSDELSKEIASGAYGALVLSDYGKGILSEDVIAGAIAAAKAADVPVIIDPKGADYGRYRGASVLTPNRRELAEATRLPVDTDADVETAARALLENCGVSAVIATRGAQGMAVVTADDCAHLPALAREVFDVSGAGDTVVATLAAGLASGLALTDAAQLANVAAGIVVAKVGTAIVRPDELGDALGGTPGPGSKFLKRHDLMDRIAMWRARGLSVGFTNGCFDLVHPGHVSLIEQASVACDRLIVALNDDASVARLKGAGRPVQPEHARGQVIASLSGVDAVVLFAEDTPRELIEQVRPDVLVKGADYAADDVVGGDFVSGYGGRVVLANLVDGFSTTDTISRISD